MTSFRRYMPAFTGALITVLLMAMTPVLSLGGESGNNGGEAVTSQDDLKVNDVRTNLGLAFEMADRVAAATMSSLGDGLRGDLIRLRPTTGHSGNPIIETALTRMVRQYDLSIAGPDLSSPLILEYTILDMQILYTGIDRSALLMGKDIKRSGNCVLFSRILDSETGIEIGNTQEEVIISDHFPYELKELVRSGGYSFTSPELNERDWTKSLEPVAVTGLLTGLIYLFFSNQSGD
jgi:hypothetical protein